MKMRPPRHDSPYYPPRARWHGRLYLFWARLENWYCYHEVRRSLGIFLNRVLPAYVVPGFGLWISGNRPKGRMVFGAYWILALIFLVELGRSISGWVLGLMIGLHAISTWAYLAKSAPLPEKSWRLARMVLWVCFYCLIYLGPLWRIVTSYAFLPLTVEGRVCVVNPRVAMNRVEMGDWVAYDRPEIRIPGYLLRAGPQLAKVYGLPGDRCSYRDGYFEVKASPRRPGRGTSPRRYASWPGMPPEGEELIDQNELFVWPKLINLNKYSGSALKRFTELEQQFAYENSRVRRDEYRGRLYQWWFWRRQTIP